MKYNRWLLRRVRNLLATLVNEAITLTILLIAPLGLAAVITNTLLVMAGTFFSEEITDFWIGCCAGVSLAKLNQIIPKPASLAIVTGTNANTIPFATGVLGNAEAGAFAGIIGQTRTVHCTATYPGSGSDFWACPDDHSSDSCVFASRYSHCLFVKHGLLLWADHAAGAGVSGAGTTATDVTGAMALTNRSADSPGQAAQQSGALDASARNRRSPALYP